MLDLNKIECIGYTHSFHPRESASLVVAAVMETTEKVIMVSVVALLVATLTMNPHKKRY